MSAIMSCRPSFSPKSSGIHNQSFKRWGEAKSFSHLPSNTDRSAPRAGFLACGVGAQGKVAAAFGRLRPAAAGCVQVGACCELVADVDLEVDARYEL
ncbi:hypothetical protein M885DRAFT_624787, partial [Pelagophyceae sp. CCMP2097]